MPLDETLRWIFGKSYWKSKFCLQVLPACLGELSPLDAIASDLSAKIAFLFLFCLPLHCYFLVIDTNYDFATGAALSAP